MKKTILTLVALASILLVPATFAGDADADAAKTHTLEGEYQWNRMEEPGPIKAVFTATGDDQWDVDFHFVFRDEPHVYSGTAKGSLTEGALEGEVMSDGDEPRPFEFAGETADGVFKGTHGTKGDDAQETGTITLSL